MKTKNRLLLTSAMMLALVAVSGTTATYAWWVSGLSVPASITDVTAAADASLEVTLQNAVNATIGGEDNLNISTENQLTDVTSADGLNFQKATLDAKDKVASLVDVSIVDDYATNVYYAISFEAKIGMALTGDLVYNVYLGDGDAAALIEETGTENDKAARMAVSTETEGSRKYFIVGNGEGIYQNTTTTTASVSNYKSAGAITEQTTTTSTTAFGDNYCIGQLNSTTTEIVIKFTLWFEGAVTKGEVKNDEFDVNLYFYSVRLVA